MGYDDYDDYDDGIDFASEGSALRAATRDNPRNLPCPTCGHPNRLTPADVSFGYQCDSCADAMERGGEIDYYEGPTEYTPEHIEKACKVAFESMYQHFSPTVQVEGAGSETIRVVISFATSNRTMSYSCELDSDGDVSKLNFELEGYYTHVIVDLEGSLI